MSDTGRKDMTDKAQEKLTPESQKSTLDQAKEGVTDAADKVAGTVQPGDDKSISQKVFDSTSTEPGEKSYLETAQNTVKDAVEYVEKTATDIANKITDSTK
ncbi:hypothetical protein MMC28_008783 [Mycoblastus sanguinarius]|nr:hypothetical protein [Mycoblastus sanguinarius]